MSEEKIEVNTQEFDTISLDNEDSTFQYTIVPNALIRDASISPNCRWLVIYLISNKPGWTIKSQQLWNHTKGFIGRDGIRKILNEAIEAGYIQRTIHIHKNLRGYSYKVASTPKFKKCFRDPEIQVTESREPEFQGPENQGTKEVLSKELLSKRTITPPIPPQISEQEVAIAEGGCEKLAHEKQKKVKASPDFSPQVREVADRMIAILAEKNQGYRPDKNLTVFLSDVRLLLEEDKHLPEFLLDAFEWAVSDTEERGGFKGWSGVIATNKAGRKITSPAGRLREHLGKITPQMKSRPKRTFAPSSDDARGLASMKEWAKGAL